MRVVSLVPSWTETLLRSGVNVVGRTRYCIHPESMIRGIPVVGGTKKAYWDKIRAIAPDVVILDREENTLEMARSCPVPFHVSHVEDLADVERELVQIAAVVKNEALARVAERWKKCVTSRVAPRDWQKLPGVVQWLNPLSKPPRQFLYLIWRDPWMAVGPRTFIASLFRHLGYAGQEVKFGEKYPKIDLGAYSGEDTLLLFSSEPYPFAQEIENLKTLGFPAAIVNGESYSWFGIRSLEFLESLGR